MDGSSKDSTSGSRTKSPSQSQIEPFNANDIDLQPQDFTKNDPTISHPPLAPPARPSIPSVPPIPQFSYVPTQGGLSNERNIFEESFAGGGDQNGGMNTPGGTKLPPVAALASGSAIGPNFWGGLRSGPLSPNMLSAPNKEQDYFSDAHLHRGGFPTPNESGLRTGLTPGGSGSMFPEPSPNGMFGVGVTPGAVEFQRAAFSAANLKKENDIHSKTHAQQQITSQPQPAISALHQMNNLDAKPAVLRRFDQHDANDAANGLYLLAQAQHSSQLNGYGPAPSNVVHGHPAQMPLGTGMESGIQSSEPSPQVAHRRSISTNGSSHGANSNFAEDEPVARNTRGKGKQRGAAPTNGKRKASGAPKASSSKRPKANGASMDMDEEPQSPKEVLDLSKVEFGSNGKKLSDDEKRKNFLERNRIAALKCRQRKKQWLTNLQNRNEALGEENTALRHEIEVMRSENLALRNLIIAHKDCPLLQSGMGGGEAMAHFIAASGFNPAPNTYGMGPGPSGQQHHHQQMHLQQQQQEEAQRQFMADEAQREASRRQ